MPSGPDTRLLRCRDALALSFTVLRHIQSDLHLRCSQAANDEAALSLAFWRCWSFVDTTHRIREVTQVVPGLGRKQQPVRTFLACTAAAESLRHYVQHLRAEMSRPSGNAFPVWGALSWVDPDDPCAAHTALAGTHIEGIGFSGMPFDTSVQNWASRVSLAAGDIVFNVDPAFEASIKLEEFVLPWITERYANPTVSYPKVPMLTMRASFVLPRDDT